MTVLPASTELSKRTVPPCAATIEATIARPSPLPPLARAREAVRAPEPLEDVRGLLGRQARAAVDDLDHDLADLAAAP